MSMKLLAAAAMSIAIAGAAFAQTTENGSGRGDPPTGFEVGDRAVFVNEDNNTMRTEAEARDRFMAMPSDRQQAIRDTCIAYRQNIAPGSADMTDPQAGAQDPVPGVFNMVTSCDWVDRF